MDSLDADDHEDIAVPSSSGGGRLSDVVELVSCDGFRFLVARRACLCSGTLRALLPDTASSIPAAPTAGASPAIGVWAETASGGIPSVVLSSLSADVLETVVRYFYWKLRYDGTAPPIPKFHLSMAAIEKLTLAASFLDT